MTFPENLKDKAFIVTGGASGLGEQVARTLHKNGAHVIIFDINVMRGNAVSGELGDRVSFYKVDVRCERTVQEMVEAACTACTVSLAGAILCSGVVLPPGNAVGYGPDRVLTSIAQFKAVVDINLIGTYNVAQHVAARLIENKPYNDDGERGVIITTSSLLGLDGVLTAYATSKAGVAGLTLPLARELSPFGVRVVSVAPGPFDTPLVQTDGLAQSAPSCLFPKRYGKPDEFASLVLHVLENPMLNGSVLRLDGGLRAIYQ
ncbi:short-chain dehydrogenase/reductase SDR [Syncephalastrum racemosum]|uniref:Short-chain dehydrogenase/reductase SDR n=1 Tax=Syncephalastrum racemosum TaxID=13706 RepID=A0A1X2HPY2_SYNRA|nr:short-chain dehydrogenase/reductase SDR [Syncephalastrum racemosum]